MEILQAKIQDAKNIASLAIQVWLDTYAVTGIRETFSEFIWNELSPEAFKKKLNNPDIDIYKVVENEHLIAMAEISYNSACPANSSLKCEIDKLYVQQNYHGKNVGANLLNFINSICKKKSIKTIWLTVYENNHRAIKFYQKHNFVEIGDTYFELGEERHRNIILTKRFPE